MSPRKKFWLVLTALIVTTTLFAPQGQASGDRLVARVDEPFEINGEVFPPGELTVRVVDVMSPVVTLHEVGVDGTSLGLVYARQTSSRVAGSDQLIFSRNDGGRLVLHALARSGEPTSTFFRFHQDGDGAPVVSER